MQLTAAVLFLTGPASYAASAPLCSDVFVSSPALQLNKDYLHSRQWGLNLKDGLKGYGSWKTALSASMPNETRLKAVLRFPLKNLIIAPGHKVLRVSEHRPDPALPGSKKVLLNAITNETNALLFLDIWDGHHRILSAFQNGKKDLADLQRDGFEIQVLINGKPADSGDTWRHILPAAASNPSWLAKILSQGAKDVEVSGDQSNYAMGSRTTLEQLAKNEAEARKRKIGIYFGTFDPVHEGHVSVAKSALTEFGLEKVILVTNALPDHKKPTPLGYRQAMVIERIKNEAGIETALFDSHFYLSKFDKSVLIEKIRQDLGSNNIYLIDGGDSFIKLLSLNQIEPTPVTNYIVNARGEDIQVPEHLKKKVHVATTKTDSMSSSDVRAEIAQGQTPDSTKMKPTLIKMIREWGLYSSGEQPATYSSEQLYSYLKEAKPLADLQFKGGEGSEKYGLTYHHNDVWQILLSRVKDIGYQVTFFKPEGPMDRSYGNRIEAEEAAFLLNRALNMDIVPPTKTVAGFRAGGKVFEKAALSYAIPNAERLLTPKHLDNSLEQQLFFSDARILNILMHNTDANDRNFLIGRHWKTGKSAPVLIDFSQSLKTHATMSLSAYPVGHTGEIKVFRRSTLEALKNLTPEKMKLLLSPLLTDQELHEMNERREGVLKYIENAVKTPSTLY